MKDEGFDRAVAIGMLGAVAMAAGLEGGVVPQYGGLAFTLAVVVGGVWVARRGVHGLPRVATAGLALIGVVLLFQLLPIPPALRAFVAPGQARWMDLAAPGWNGDMDTWLSEVARYDVLAAVGAAGGWSLDVLSEAHDTAWRPGAIAPDSWRWALGQLLAMAVVWVVGAGLGRSHTGTRTVLIGMVLLSLGEAMFGFANRNGPSTGIGLKTYQLGSVTGTFINRGHLGAFLVLGVGALWGLAAAHFPLLPDEVRQHMKRSRRSSQPPSVFEASGDKIPRLLFLSVIAAVLLVAVVASQGRGPTVALAVSGLALGAFIARIRPEEKFHLGIAATLPAVGGVLAVAAFGIGGAFGRFRGMLSGDGSVTARLDLWRDSLTAWMDAPVFGAGLGAWPLAHALRETPTHLFAFSNAHDEPIEILVEMGLVGALGWSLVLFAGSRGAVRALRTVPHDDNSAAGIGALVAVCAVLLQSLADFPLHIPGVALPWALMGGLAHGALTTPSQGRRWPVFGIGVVGIGLCLQAAAADATFVGSREDRLAERGTIWRDADREGEGPGTLERWRDRAAALTELRPLDPWPHAALAEAEARLAARRYEQGGAFPAGDGSEAHAWRAELSAARALRLRPGSPRLVITVAQAIAVAGERSPTPDAARERTVRLLADAVRRDPWRAEDALKVARRYPVSDLPRVVADVAGTGRERARALHALGRALEARGANAEAEEAHLRATTADPTYGPPWYAAAILAKKRGEALVVDERLKRFLEGEERPPGMEGWALILLGQLDAAEPRLRRVVQESPDNRWAWEGLAEIGKQRGRIAEERAALEQIVRITPGHAAATKRLGELE